MNNINIVVVKYIVLDVLRVKEFPGVVIIVDVVALFVVVVDNSFSVVVVVCCYLT